MSEKLRYYRDFGGQKGDKWRVEIYQQDYTGEATEVTLSANPVMINWSAADKYEPLQPSSATVELVSVTDRQFFDMYQVKAGYVRLNVMLNGALYWSGTLDPELYEEPYYREKNYYVSLTFSDFAILSRKKWTVKGFRTIRQIVDDCVKSMQLQYTAMDTYISTQLTETDTQDILTALSLNTLNFFDEDGTAMTMQDVLAEVLRPFSLRIIQKAGKLHLYDINKIHSAFKPETVSWRNASSLLSQDRIYNNVRIVYSPYGASELIDAQVREDTVVGGKTYPYTLTPGDVATPGFDLRITDEGDGDMVIGALNPRYFNIAPLLSGSEECGIAQYAQWLQPDGSAIAIVTDPVFVSGWVAKLKEPVFVCKTNSSAFRLRLTVEMMVDPRYNPFEPADEGNNDRSNGNFDKLVKIFWQRCMLSVKKDKEATNPDYIYSNRGIWNTNNLTGTAEWKAWGVSSQDEGEMSICYYEDDRENTPAMGGWKSNKQTIGNYYGALPSYYARRGAGEFIEIPPITGWVDFKLNSDCRGKNADGSSVGSQSMQRFFHLIKSIRLEVVDNRTFKVVPQEDEETTAWLNEDALEELPLNTIIGTMEVASPIAKGQIFKTSDYSVVSKLYRAGVTDRVEKLMIGSIYSNYASRHPMLTGDVALVKTFTLLTDNNLPGKYITLEESQNLRSGISSISMVQVDADNYKGA